MYWCSICCGSAGRRSHRNKSCATSQEVLKRLQMLRKVDGEPVCRGVARRSIPQARYLVQTRQKIPRASCTLELLPLLNSRRLELPDDARLLGQLQALERRAGSTGRDVVDHPPGAHDDVANAAAGALVLGSTIAESAAAPLDVHVLRAGIRRPAVQLSTLPGRALLPRGPVCRPCPGKLHAQAAYRGHVERGGDPIGLNEFTADRFTHNDFTSRRAMQRGIDWLHL